MSSLFAKLTQLSKCDPLGALPCEWHGCLASRSETTAMWRPHEAGPADAPASPAPGSWGGGQVSFQGCFLTGLPTALASKNIHYKEKIRVVFSLKMMKNKWRPSVFRPVADGHLHGTAPKQRADALLTGSTSGNRGCVLCPGNPIKETQRLKLFFFFFSVHFPFVLLCCSFKSNDFVAQIWVHTVFKLVAADTRFNLSISWNVLKQATLWYS